MEAPSKSLTVSRRVLRLLVAANIVFALLILALLIATLVAREPVVAALGIPTKYASAGLVAAMRLIMIAGIASAAISHFILLRLLAIVDTVRHGDPFTAGNAARLRGIAWALLAVELTHHLTGAIAASASTEPLPIDIGWGISPTRWIAVLLLFVLAQVFDHGAGMRADLEGTV
jgi:hypothetical protein